MTAETQTTTLVTFNGVHIYPAHLDPATTYTGPENALDTIPRFTLDTVTAIAEDFEEAHNYRYDNTDSVTVSYGNSDCDCEWECQCAKLDRVVIFRANYGRGAPFEHTLVLPDADGLYSIGGGQWIWRMVPPTLPELPSDPMLYAAIGGALEARRVASIRIGNGTGIAIAAAWRTAQPDAAHAELTRNDYGHVRVTGRYWTAAGEERALDPTEVYSQWVCELDDRDAWDVINELTTPLPDDESLGSGWSRFKFDLAEAVNLPLD